MPSGSAIPSSPPKGRSTKETLCLTDYGTWQDHKPDKNIVVEYIEIPHWKTTPRDGKLLKAYEVLVDGQKVGKVEQTIISTDRKAGRLRIPGHGRVGWAWGRPGKIVNGVMRSPEHGTVYGYVSNRRMAVAGLLDYSEAKKVS